MRRILLITTIFPLLLFSQAGTKKMFNKENCPIFPKCFTSISADEQGINWIGTLEGVFCYNGDVWQNINTKNSKIPSNKIFCIEIIDNTKYIGTSKGLVVVKNGEWEIYNIKNSALPSNKVRKIKKDRNNIIWIATSKGLVKYNQEFEVVLSEKKNGILDDDFVSLNIDQNNKVWIGTNSGLYSYQDKIFSKFGENLRRMY